MRRSRPALINDVLEFEDLQLFPSRMEVFRGSVRVVLAPKEYRLLSVFIERPGQVFSRSQLLDLVWGRGVYVEERTVDVYVSRLRRALDNAGNEPLKNLIRAIRGSGYSLKSG